MDVTVYTETLSILTHVPSKKVGTIFNPKRFQTEIERNEIERRSVLGRKCKKGVMKVLGTLGAETEIEAENSETPFNEEMQELLRKGEVIAACNASVKDGVMGAYWVIMTRKMRPY